MNKKELEKTIYKILSGECDSWCMDERDERRRTAKIITTKIWDLLCKPKAV